jgi:dephospho-CoA kinase
MRKWEPAVRGPDRDAGHCGAPVGRVHPMATVRAYTDTARLPAVLVVGLTGGIGSGKSTVSAMLAGHGAVVIDADAITRELQEPGTEVFDAMVERFGPQIVAADGSLDRQAVADVVLNDADALADLNAIVHPAVGVEIATRLAAAADAPVATGATAPIVVLDVPLLVETGRSDLAAVIVVDTDPDLQLQRLVDQRGLDAADATARMARQATRQQRLDRADQVIDNTLDLEHLRRETDRVWSWLCDLQVSST